LKPTYYETLSKFAFKFNLRHNKLGLDIDFVVELKDGEWLCFAYLGREVIENKHSTDVESMKPRPRVCMSIHPEGV